MEFGWTAVQQHRYDEALAAARDLPAEAAEAADRPPGGLDRRAWSALARIGLLGAAIAPELGGQGLGALDTARLFEAVGRGSIETGIVFGAAAQLFACAIPIADFGGEPLRKRILPGVCAGELVLGNAMTEAEAGSDVSRLATRATATAGGYLLTGEKTFVSNGPAADAFVVYTTTDPRAGHLGLTAFAVDRDTPGLTVGEPFDKLGMSTCPAGPVRFEDCFVPDGAVLGEPGQGSMIFQHSMGWERSCLFALYLGVQDRLIEAAVHRARTRRQFGRRLAEFQAVSHRIVEMKARVDGARLLLYRACWLLDRDEPAGLAGALSKLAVSEAAVAGAVDALRVAGGRGYLRGSGPEAALRDAIGGLSFSGTSDIQRELAAAELGL